jgi:hypothetical protein
MLKKTSLTTETIEGTALSLECVDNIEGSNSLALCVLSVCDSIADNTFEEGLENTSGLLVDHWEDGLDRVNTNQTEELTGWNTLDTTTTRETTDSRLCDALDVVTKNLAVTLCSTLSETLATFSACRENASVCWYRKDARYRHKAW